MSVELLDSLKKQTTNLTPQEKFVLAKYLLEQAPFAPPQNGSARRDETADQRRRQRMDWMKANQEEHGGQYVVLDGDNLVGIGRTYPEAVNLARTSGLDDLFVTYLPKPDELGYVGGWL
ncbi:MAG TPA: DUF5678 domain-containing protein [Blastocatellia bacterium]|nr:DUF5678 domain-containing protein [Blastocatellia bacterium]HMV83374.1 DUF5678 domain-containing protein [Blastocatellia bacterium]HMX24239.1 DUF5678 domain-containing protein [Blastocatellia bacterium]HMY71689.1 DUF5678 domain-containing protein [Blastocatellia bacterium]HMZ18418.1 DUF5678 domain-containing protein [Blastocatellia bacterium]